MARKYVGCIYVSGCSDKSYYELGIVTTHLSHIKLAFSLCVRVARSMALP